MVIRNGPGFKLDAEQHLKIASWFGEVGADFPPHPKQIHPSILRISNDPKEGNLGTGADGWHVDGYFTEKPFLMNVMHFYEVSEGGETWLSPLKEVVESLEPEVREEWE